MSPPAAGKGGKKSAKKAQPVAAIGHAAGSATDVGADWAESDTERLERAERLTRRMEALEAEFIKRQAEFERSDSHSAEPRPPFGDEFFRGFGDLFPDQARTHLLNAQREWAYALKELIEYWIERSGGKSERRPPPDRPKVM